MDIVTIDGLPVYQALVNDEDCGMLRISLVDEPAVMSNFLSFGDQKKIQMYAVQDEEKRLVLGVVMRADFPIYRRSEEMGEFYVIYKADTIRTMAEKYLAENRQNLVNLMHQDGSEVEGVQMVQYFIKGAGLSPEGFDDIADGSLFAEFHVTNDEVWDAIKDGTYRGFSLEGVFDLAPERSVDYVEEVVNALDGFFSRLFRNQPKIYNKMKMKGLLARLAKELVEMGNVTTDKGVLAWDGDEDLKAGDAVFLEDEEGNRTPAADDNYTTADGKIIVVVDGKVSEIKDPEAEVDPSDGGEFASKATDNGTLEWEGEEDLKEGDEVFITDEEGNRNPAPDGDYKTEDGKVITVVDGKVASIVDDEADVAPIEARKQRFAKMKALFEESYEDKSRKILDAIIALGFDAYGWLVEAGDDFAVYCVWGEAGEHYTRFDVAWDAEGNAIVTNPREVEPAFVEPEAEGAEPAPSAEEVAELRKQNAEMKAQLEKLAQTPAGQNAHNQHEGAPMKTGIEKFDRLARIMSAK